VVRFNQTICGRGDANYETNPNVRWETGARSTWSRATLAGEHKPAVSRHVACDVSQRCRKRIEEVFGWIKTTGGVAQVKDQAVFTFAMQASNLLRIPKLLEAT
jgi:hypothetical protein